MKALLIGGGEGTRMAPLSQIKSKHLLSVYDKPMVFYPLALLMQLGFRDIILSLHQEDLGFYQSYFADGSQWGIQIEYLIQPRDLGLGYTIASTKKLLANQSLCAILGDNFFYGETVLQDLRHGLNRSDGVTCYCKAVTEPRRFGVVSFSEKKPIKIVEKPQQPESNFAVTGFYVFSHETVNSIPTMKSELGQLDLTDILQHALSENKLSVKILQNDVFWRDMGTVDSLLETANFVQTQQQALKTNIGCPSQTAWQLGLINGKQLKAIAKQYQHSQYGQTLLNLLRTKND